MTRTRVRLAAIVLIAVVIYTAFIAVMVESNNSGLGILVVLGVTLCAAIALVWLGRPLLMIAAVVGILIYTFSVAVSTQVATGREDDPFESCTLANNWQDLIGGEECE